MPPLLQLLLVTVILLSCIFLSVAAFQVFHILHEVQLLIKKLNRIAANTDTLSTASAKPITAFNQFFTDVKDLVNTTQDEIIAATPDRVVTPPASSNDSPATSLPPRRFFRRAGQFLRPN